MGPFVYNFFLWMKSFESSWQLLFLVDKWDTLSTKRFLWMQTWVRFAMLLKSTILFVILWQAIETFFYVCVYCNFFYSKLQLHCFWLLYEFLAEISCHSFYPPCWIFLLDAYFTQREVHVKLGHTSPPTSVNTTTRGLPLTQTTL